MDKNTDNNTNVEALKKRVQKFCEDRDWDQYHGPKELAIGMVTEASELLAHFRFKNEKEILEMLKNKKKSQEIKEELSDVLAFVLRMSQMYNIDLSTELQNKLEKNDKKYPVEKARGSNKKYTEFQK